MLKAERTFIEGVYQIVPTKAVKLSDQFRCELWTYPLWGFGKYFKRPPVKREPLIASVIGDPLTLSPVTGAENRYRSGDAANSDLLMRIDEDADGHAKQLTQLGQIKEAGEKFLSILGIALILELIVFAAVVLPVAWPKIQEAMARQP